MEGLLSERMVRKISSILPVMGLGDQESGELSLDKKRDRGVRKEKREGSRRKHGRVCTNTER